LIARAGQPAARAAHRRTDRQSRFEKCRNVFAVFHRLSVAGLAIVMVTHDLGLAAHAGRTIELSKTAT
jgi:hypothetical protein